MITLEKHIVYPGKLMVSATPTLISTLLGSCVSVCLWDKKFRIGGMNHYLLPGTEADDADNANRGLPSIRMLLDAMFSKNASPENIEAKIFGGCNSLYKNNDMFRIGERNVAMAFEVMKGVGIPVVAHHTGGAYGRKIVFNTGTGKVRMRLLIQSVAEINEKINKSLNY